MKINTILLLIIFASLLACKNQHNDSQTFKNNKIKVSPEVRLRNWLNEYGIEKSYFKDSSKHKSFELWAYTNNLNESNHDELKEFSIDSSFRLVSNFDKMAAQNGFDLLPEEKRRFFGFLPKDKSEYYIGISFTNNHPDFQIKTRLLDYKWLGNDEFGFLTESIDKGEQKFYLTKLKIETDTIWEYNPK